MRQLVRVFTEPGFDVFLPKLPEQLYIAAMTQYTESPDLHVIIPPPNIINSLSEVLAVNGKKHLHIAETEKYAHVTFFFNGLHNKPFDGETDIFIESPENLLEHPEMKAAEIAEKVCSELQNDIYDFYVINFANADMLAHLGVLETAVKGVEAVDAALARIKEKVLEKGGIMVITADHGNAESMIYKGTGEKETRHDDNPVPLYLIGAKYARPTSSEKMEQARASVAGLLADVAPTILELMGLPQPAEMTGQSFLNTSDFELSV
jgi:2,3-bisphosphoglycerate-independent phosphoglycerate mutase